MNMNEIYEECNNVVSDNMMDSVQFYFDEYPDQREDFAKGFKKSFCFLIDFLLKASEIEEEEEE